MWFENEQKIYTQKNDKKKQEREYVKKTKSSHCTPTEGPF